MKKVVFFFPWPTVSGGPYYLCRMADDLAATGRYEVYYTDYYNGISDGILNDFRVRKIPYFGKAFDMELFLDEPIVLITPIYWAFAVPKLHPDSKILFVNWHNSCIPDLCQKWKIDGNQQDLFFELLQHGHGVFFADKAHQLAQNEITGYLYDDTFVPIIMEPRELSASQSLISEGEYNIAILGRLSPDKVPADVDLIENIAALPIEKTINIHVIGNGVQEDVLFDRQYTNNINIIKYGTLPLDEVISVLREKVDLLFAMGTSALEGGSIGLPTVIIPNEEQEFHCDKYVYLSKSSGYALGWSCSQIDQLGLEWKCVGDILADIYERGQKARIGRECYDYVLQNHTSNIEHAEQAIVQCEFCYKDLQPFVRPEPMKTQGVTIPEKQTKNHFAWVKKVCNRIGKAVGRPIKRFCVFDFPIVAVTMVDDRHFNFFLCGIPLLRIKKKWKSYSINLLLLVWVGKVFKKLFAKLIPHSDDDKEAPLQIDLAEARRKRIADKLAHSEKIRVCLFEPRISCWQFGNLYRLLENSGVFEPIVVVIPFMTMGDDAMNEFMDTTYAALREQGYRVVKGYDKDTETFLDIRKELEPDAVFYSMFWKNHFHENSYINKFEDIYTFLYPYGYDIVSHPDRESMNFELQNKVLRYYLPTKIHKGIALDNMDNHAENVYVTGSPKLDNLVDKFYLPEEVWLTTPGKKRVIWAPHHTLIEEAPHSQLCAFLDLCDYMLELAGEYQNSVHFAFKPHPMLKQRLYDIWGKRKTDTYYAAWENGVNTQIEDGAFCDLFLTSDAMILDSLSFIGEYTIINKPAFFTYGKNTRLALNRFGKAIIKVLYRNRTAETLFEDIKAFIDDVVLSGMDTKKNERSIFIQQFMLPENSKTAAENIYEDMCRVILQDEFVEYKMDWSHTFGG